MAERLDPDREADRLQQVEERIEEARRETADVLDSEDEPLFIQRGDVRPDEVDDTIAPPG